MNMSGKAVDAMYVERFIQRSCGVSKKLICGRRFVRGGGFFWRRGVKIEPKEAALY